MVGPGTGSARSYQCASCDGQKYGPLKTSFETENLHAAASGFFDERDVGVDRRLPNFGDGRRWIAERRGRLNEAADDLARHGESP